MNANQLTLLIVVGAPVIIWLACISKIIIDAVRNHQYIKSLNN